MKDIIETRQWNGRDVEVCYYRAWVSHDLRCSVKLKIDGMQFEGYCFKINDKEKMFEKAIEDLENCIRDSFGGELVSDYETFLKLAKEKQKVATWLVNRFNL